MEIVYSFKAEDDLKFWKKSGNVIIQKKIQELLNSIKLTPFEGIGKPELLKYNLSGSWSRRINQEHRIVYDIYEEDDTVLIQSLKGHY